MKSLAGILLLLLSLGCARIYRPVALASPAATLRGEGLAGQVVLQPWGDNSRYERKALDTGLRVAVLRVENSSSGDLDLRLQVPEESILLPPDAAAKLIKQPSLAYLLYPVVPGLISLGSSNRGAGYGPSDRVAYQGLAILGLCVGLPNAAVAARSNHRLEAFFRGQAWAPGPIGPGQARQGLVFLRSRDPYLPTTLRVVYRGPDGERSLPLEVPGARPR